MNRINSYQAALDFLYNSLPMFQRQGAAAMKKDLGNIRKLCKALNHPEAAWPSIHVAGTNGKGSSTHMLSAMLQAQGLRVGVYTSPHYKDFRERIKINTELMPKRQVLKFMQQHIQLIESIKPSFFEISVAMAFDYFAREEVDVAVIEVGLGGRLDSTNVINPSLCLITNISLDHTQFLGNTLPEIAAEKAGIIKPNTAVVISETQDSVKEVFKTIAKERNADIQFADQSIKLQYNQERSELEFKINGNTHRTKLPWFIDFQLANLRGALASFIQYCSIQAIDIDWTKTLRFLEKMPEKTYFLGRWMILQEKPLTIADSAHNAAGLRNLKNRLSEYKFDKLHIVLGFSNDKDIEAAMHWFPNTAKFYYAKADIPRGMSAEELRVRGNALGYKGKAYKSVRYAYAAAKRSAKANDLIYVGGSIFVVAEVLPER